MFTFDDHSNLAIGQIATAPAPALTGTSITVRSGQGALFPAAPFNCTVFPPNVTPLQSNAEIVRVTAVVGDVLTITRAQEGTTAKAISVSWQISNSISVKVITDLETAVNSVVQSVSAGTQSGFGPQIVFADSNGISFGMSGSSQITASFSGGGGGSINFSAGTQSADLNSVVFSNSNGVTFGLNGGGIMTASVAGGVQSTQPVAASASNGSFLFSTLGFSNGNGVTFGTSAGSIITASIAASAVPGVAFSGGTSSANLTQLVFSNSNGVSFGLNGSTLTGSHNGLTAQSTQPVAASASNGSFLFSTLGFSNGNGVTFGTSAGSIITASVAAGGGGSVNFSAGTQSSNLASVVFSNSNGVTFGLSNGTITASASGGTGVGALANGFQNEPIGSWTRVLGFQSDRTLFTPVIVPYNLNANFLRFPAVMTVNESANIAGTITTANISWELRSTIFAVIYSLGSGASAQQLFSVAGASAFWTFQNSLSVSNTSNHSHTQGVTVNLSGNSYTSSSSYSQSSASYNFFSSGLFADYTGTKFIDLALTQSLSAGQYYFGCAISSQSSANNATFLTNATNNNVTFQSFIGPVAALNLIPGLLGYSTVSYRSGFQMAGFVVVSAPATYSSVDLSAAVAVQTNYRQFFQIYRTA